MPGIMKTMFRAALLAGWWTDVQSVGVSVSARGNSVRPNITRSKRRQWVCATTSGLAETRRRPAPTGVLTYEENNTK